MTCLINFDNLGNYSLSDLNWVNILLGKNGCGKSTALKAIDIALKVHPDIGLSKYITPERGGALKYQPQIEANISSDPNWLDQVSRKNQFTQFKETSVFQFRKLEMLALRELERNVDGSRLDLSITFDTTIGLINSLLDNIEIRRESSDFKIYQKLSGEPITAENISSGESELISLGIECLVFDKECKSDKTNVLILDEPDVHLHPDLQVRLAIFLKKIILQGKFRVLIATHSTSFLGAFEGYDGISVEFAVPKQKQYVFKKVSDIYKRVIPVFGAHPLSNIFNEAPLLLVEGEDDERIWQQAVRTSKGKIKIYPCPVDSIVNLSEYEIEAAKIIKSIYDNAKAYSLRDRDDDKGELDDMPPVVRLRLACRAAENLLLADDCLSRLNISWQTLTQKIDQWILKNPDHPHFTEMNQFKINGYDRMSWSLKEIRNDIMGIIGSNKPWEVVVGQTIGSLICQTKAPENSLQSYLGEKTVAAFLS